jgi:uncharacterized delta-60 repeat protein
MKHRFSAFRSASSVSLLLLFGLVLWRVSRDEIRENHGSAPFVPGFSDAAAAFEKRLEQAPSGGFSEADERTLVAMARQRAAMLSELARTRPAAARERLMSIGELAKLPEAVRRECEQPWSAAGDFVLQWETSENSDGSIECRHLHMVRAGGESAEAFGPHLREATRSLSGEFFQGHKIGGIILLDDAVTRRLTGDEVTAAERWFAPAAKMVDPVTGNDATDGIPAVIAGRIHRFESEQTLAAFEDTMREARDSARDGEVLSLRNPYPVLADGGGTGGGGTEAAPTMDDDINVLFIRVDFSDFAGEANSIAKANLESTLATVATRIDQYSYGAASLTYTVSNTLYRMPATGASYATAGNNDGIRDAARALAAANYNLANYDVVAVYFPDLSGVANSKITYGGLAGVGYGDHWINGSNSISVILHEFGHNYGLFHANFWNPEGDLGGTRYDDPGYDSLEYGDIFDRMGSGGEANGYFSPYATSRLGWMPSAKVITPSANGTFRIHRFDTAAATSQNTLALRVPMGGNVFYWVGFRKAYGSPYNLASAAYVVAEGLYANRPNLIDMTPNSIANPTSDRDDCGLAVGSVFNDTAAGVRFETVATGGAAGSEWIDVNVQFTPRLEIAESAVEVDEDAGLARLTLKRYFGSAGAASVTYATANGTATAGSDYLSASGTVTWPAGDVSDKVIAVPIRPDSSNEGIESFTVALSSPVGAVISAGKGTSTVSILDPGRRFAGFAPGFFNLAVEAVVPLPDGKVIIGGDISAGIGSASGIRHIARLNPDGSVDSDFLTGLGFNAPVTDILLEPDGKLVVAGDFTSYDGTACNRLIRLNANGTADTAFVSAYGAGPDAPINALARESSGTLLVAGDFSNFAGQPARRIVRLLPTGARDTVSPVNVDPVVGSISWIDAVAALPDGKILIAGGLSQDYDFTIDGFRSGIVRLLANGSRDTTFDVGAGAHSLAFGRYSLGYVTALAVQPDGKVVVGGEFTAWNGTAATRMVRLNTNGATDGTFTPPAFGNIPLAILRQPNGSFVVGGWFNSPVSRLARLTSSGSLDSTWNPGGTPGGLTNPSVRAISQDPAGGLLVGGNFFSYAGVASRPVVRVAAGGGDAYDRWMATRFSAAQIAGGLALPGVDADNDGATNLLESAVGTSPTSSSSVPLGAAVTTVSSGGQQYLQVTFTKGPDATGLWIGAQFSTGLGSWLPVSPTPGSNATYTVIEDSAARLVVRDNTPVSANDRRFGRIVVRRPE